MSDDKDAEVPPPEEEEVPREPTPVPKSVLTVTVNCATALWDTPEGEEAEGQTASVSFMFGDADEPAESEPVPLVPPPATPLPEGEEAPEEDKDAPKKPTVGTYTFDLTKAYEREKDARNDFMQELLTHPLCVTIYCTKEPKDPKASKEKVAVGTVTLDLLPLVHGATSVGGLAQPVAVLPQERVEMLEAPALDVLVSLDEALVTPEEAALHAVMEMRVVEVVQLPAELVTASKDAGDPFTFKAGVPLPCGDGKERVLSVSGGAMSYPEPPPAPEGEEEDKDAPAPEAPPPLVTFEGPAARFYLPGDALELIREALEGGKAFPVELARYLSNPQGDLTDPMYEQYHGEASLALPLLLEPGNSTTTVTAPLAAYVAPEVPEAPPSPEGDKDAPPPEETPAPMTVLPAPEANANGKAKPVEVVAEGAEGSPWVAAGSVVTIEVSLSRPIYPPWVEPEAPTVLLSDLVPQRPVPQPPSVPAGQAAFHEHVRAIARALAAEYSALFRDALPSKYSTSAPQEQLRRKNALVFELNRQGQYLAMKSKLKEAVVAIVKERWQKSGDMHREEMAELYNEVYIHLVEEMHQALASIGGASADALSKKAPTPVPALDRLEELKALASEYEVSKDWARSEKFHQERAIAARNPQVWYDYGMFLMRKGPSAYGKAEECFKEACALDPDSPTALLSLAALLCHNGYYDAAARCAHEAKALIPDSGMVWALLGLIYERQAKTTEARNSVYEAKRLGRQASTVGDSKIQSRVYLALGLFLLDMELHDLATTAVERQITLDGGEPGVDLLLCQGRALSLSGGWEAAVECYGRAADADAKDLRARVLLGNVYFDLARYPDAVREYTKAMTISSGQVSIPLELYLRLGKCHEATGNWGAAMDTYVNACWARPCCSTWLGAGVAFFKMGDYANADLALTEANVLDNKNPLVWGYLALANLVSGRTAEAAAALKWAFKEELADAGVIAAVGRQYSAMGMWGDAEVCFRRSIALGDDPRMRVELGEALWEQNDAEGARVEYMGSLRRAEQKGDADLKVEVLPRLAEVNTFLGYGADAHSYGVELAKS
mmetsp:Transcript_45518/g.144787  ORF Transcript_45518/g.144787 Transcript_45518/m.144787 type:complete len:1066 (-) Transcript_45518:1094-4291(-)